jgi:aminoglycoside phosphotransferase (APT) family kinase protein
MNTLSQAVESILDALRREILSDVRSPQARTALLSSIRLLGRVLEELEGGNQIPCELVEKWGALKRQLATPMPGGALPSGAADCSAGSNETEHALSAASSAIQQLLRLPDESATHWKIPDRWFRDANDAHREFFERREIRLSKLIEPTDPPADSETRPLQSALNAYMSWRFPELGPDSVRSVRILPGGYQKQTALLELRPNERLPTRLVVRRDNPQGGSTGTTVANELPLLAQMHDAGLPVPKPLLGEADAKHIGGGFVMMEEVVGATRAGELFPELTSNSTYHADFPFEVARVLAALHRMTSLPKGFTPSGFVASGDDIIANVKGFQQLWRDSANPPFTSLVDVGFAWLLANPLPKRDLRRIVHADVGAHNILVRGGHLAALLDWELTHIGDPAQDLAFVRTLLIEPLVPWTQFLDGYLAAGGPAEACDVRAVDWFSIWNHVRNSVYTGIVFQKVRDGALRDVSSVAAGWDYSARLQRYLAKDLDRVL